jgi:hypothetical protein
MEIFYNTVIKVFKGFKGFIVQVHNLYMLNLFIKD